MLALANTKSPIDYHDGRFYFDPHRPLGTSPKYDSESVFANRVLLSYLGEAGRGLVCAGLIVRPKVFIPFGDELIAALADAEALCTHG